MNPFAPKPGTAATLTTASPARKKQRVTSPFVPLASPQVGSPDAHRAYAARPRADARQQDSPDVRRRSSRSPRTQPLSGVDLPYYPHFSVVAAQHLREELSAAMPPQRETGAATGRILRNRFCTSPDKEVVHPGRR